jgi:hypothetical protein
MAHLAWVASGLVFRTSLPKATIIQQKPSPGEAPGVLARQVRS